MLQSFQETVKIYEQGKRYYDALKASATSSARPARCSSASFWSAKSRTSMSMVINVWFPTRTSRPRSWRPSPQATPRIIEESAGGIEGAAEHREPYGHVPDGQGSYRRGAARLRRPAAPPRSGTLLHAQEHLHIPAAGRRKRDMEGVLSLYGTDEQRYW